MISVKFSDAMFISHDDRDYLMLELPDYEQKTAAKKFCSEKHDRLYVAELKIHRNKRSLNANAYAWLLMGKLAAKLNLTMTEIYRQYIRDVGDNFELLSIRDEAVNKMGEIWQSRGLGWLCDNLGPDMNNPGNQNILLYFGSSTYDTKQMANLITLIVNDCREQDIETLPPEELERMKEEWERHHRDL